MKDQHKWIKKNHIAAHVYRWICEECGTEAFNIDGDEPSHCSVPEVIKYGTYSDTYITITDVNDLMSCSECAIKGVIE